MIIGSGTFFIQLFNIFIGKNWIGINQAAIFTSDDLIVQLIREPSGREDFFVNFINIKILLKNYDKVVFFTDGTGLIYHSLIDSITTIFNDIIGHMKMRSSAKLQLYENLKQKMLGIAYKTNSRHVHIGSCLSCFDILFQLLLFEKKPQDKFILSKGHAALALYILLNYQRIISDKTLATYLQSGSALGIHPSSFFPKEIPLATGSLGHGLSFACGLSKGYLLQNKKPMPKVYCLVSDGECNEGSVWEAALFAARHRLHNLVVIIDKNNLQAFGKTKDVLGEAASREKFLAFGFNVFECDGHNLVELERCFKKIKKLKNNRPNIMIANTLRGKGIKAIEGKLLSNYIPVTANMI